MATAYMVTSVARWCDNHRVRTGVWFGAGQTFRSEGVELYRNVYAFSRIHMFAIRTGMDAVVVRRDLDGRCNTKRFVRRTIPDI